MQAQPTFTIGDSITSLGKWVRFVLGVLLPLGFAASHLTSGSPWFFARLALYFAGILAVYMAAHYLLGDRLIARVNPWVSTIPLVGPAVVVPFMPFLPTDFKVAMTLYVAVSMLVNIFISYGGCEVLGIPSLISARRYVVYCPWNALDVVEQGLIRRQLDVHPRRDAASDGSP